MEAVTEKSLCHPAGRDGLPPHRLAGKVLASKESIEEITIELISNREMEHLKQGRELFRKEMDQPVVDRLMVLMGCITGAHG